MTGVALAAIAVTGYTGGTAQAATATTTATAAKRDAARTAALAAPAYQAAARNLTQGMAGADVRSLQRRLAALKYYPGATNGVFGTDTLEALWAFQEVNGLTADGVVGTATKRALAHPRTFRPNDARYSGTRIEVNLSMRVLVLYENNAIALISHVSSGGGYYFCTSGGCTYAVTPTGAFRTTAYMPGWVTVPLGEMYNPVFFVGTAFAIHGDTYVPVNPVSHGCVRIPMDIASFFHTMVRTPGTEVFVYR